MYARVDGDGNFNIEAFVFVVLEHVTVRRCYASNITCVRVSYGDGCPATRNQHAGPKQRRCGRKC